jgi:hypothetical protein
MCNDLGHGSDLAMSNRNLQAAAAVQWDSSAVASPTAAHALAQMVRGGRRDAPRTALNGALVVYWGCVRSLALPQRHELCKALREAIRRGDTTVRAWLPIVLGEPCPALVRDAALAYVAAAPASLEQKLAAIDDACDWIRRDLGLSKAGIFAALLVAADPALLERIASLRWRLDARQRAVVFELTAGVSEPAVRELLDDWRAAAVC